MEREQFVVLYPFESLRRVFSTFDQNFDFKIRREHQKNFSMSAASMSP